MSEGQGEEDHVSSSNHLQHGLKARCEEDGSSRAVFDGETQGRYSPLAAGDLSAISRLGINDFSMSS